MNRSSRMPPIVIHTSHGDVDWKSTFTSCLLRLVSVTWDQPPGSAPPGGPPLSWSGNGVNQAVSAARSGQGLHPSSSFPQPQGQSNPGKPSNDLGGHGLGALSEPPSTAPAPMSMYDARRPAHGAMSNYGAQVRARGVWGCKFACISSIPSSARDARVSFDRCFDGSGRSCNENFRFVEIQ